MPGDTLIQYGSFGLVVFVVGWFVMRGFPQMVTALTTSVDRVLTKIDLIESQCREERREMFRAFRDELELERRASREEFEADRKARHEQGAMFQQALAEMGLTQAKKSTEKE